MRMHRLAMTLFPVAILACKPAPEKAVSTAASKQAAKPKSPKPSGKASTGVVYSDVLRAMAAERLGRG